MGKALYVQHQTSKFEARISLVFAVWPACVCTSAGVYLLCAAALNLGRAAKSKVPCRTALEWVAAVSLVACVHVGLSGSSACTFLLACEAAACVV